MTVFTNDDVRPELAAMERVSTRRTVTALAFESLAALWRAAEGLYEQFHNRRGISALLELDDSVLRDIGVTRDEVRRAVNLPWTCRAGEELSRARNRSLERDM